MGMTVAADRVRDRAHADEAALVARLRSGDEAAYHELVRTYGPRMLAVARRILPRDDDARDAVQDAFGNVCRSVGGFHENCLLSTWLHRVVFNAALMRYRRQRRRPEVFLEDRFPCTWEAQAASVERSGSEFVDDSMFRGEVRARVRASIERLPERYRGVVLLRDIEGLDVPTIGDLLAIGAGSAKMRLHRGHRALQRLLRGFARGDRLR